MLKEVFFRLSEKKFIGNTYISRERHIECLRKTRKYLEKSKQKRTMMFFRKILDLPLKKFQKYMEKLI